MRRTFGKVITELARTDEKICLLVGDIGYRVFDEFRQEHPKQFINMGICEQSLIGVSAGLALEGLKPWVYTITPFLIERPFEQIKLDIDLENFTYVGMQTVEIEVLENTKLIYLNSLGIQVRHASLISNDQESINLSVEYFENDERIGCSLLF